MKKNIIILLFIIFSLGCEEKKEDCKIEFSNEINYKGYGIIKFNISHTGSIRYLEFYPLCNVDIENFEISKISTKNLNNGLVIRENSNSKIWNKLINDKRINLDKDKYGIALVYLDFNKKKAVNKEKKAFTNYLNIHGKGFKICMIDVDLYNVNTKEIDIIKGL